MSMKVYSRRQLMMEMGRPYDAEIEYLESDGASYIDTGVNNGSTFHFDLDASILGVYQGATIIGSSTVNDTSSTYIGILNKLFTWRFSNGTYSIRGLTVVADVRHNFNNIASWRNLVIDNTYQTNVTGGSVTSLRPVYLFCRNSGGTATYFSKTKLYYCKLYTNTTLVRDYIPVRIGNTGYLYDKVSGKLFGNAGTGNFVLGPDK